MLLRVETTHLFSPTHRLRANELVWDKQPGSRRLEAKQQILKKRLLQSQRGQCLSTGPLNPHENSPLSLKVSPPFLLYICAQSHTGSFLTEGSLALGP